MFKPLPTDTIGYITEAASRFTTTLVVDSALWGVIASKLSASDWTYLEIQSSVNTEVVKVTNVLTAPKIRVARGMEGTFREAIVKNSRAEYNSTFSGLYDQVRAMVSPITLTATGVAKVNPIYAPIVDIESNAALEIVDDGHIFPGNYKACEPYICAGYTIGPYYLTSQIYPIEVIERMYSTAGWIRSRFLTPQVDQISATASWLSGSLRDLLQAYGNWPPESITATASWLYGDIHTLLRAYDPTGLAGGEGRDQITATAAWLYGDIRTLLIPYTNWPHEDITFTGSWVYGALT